MKKYDVVIIGAGIIGASIAYELSRYKLDVLVVEKNPKVADETSLGNSGLIHGGFDPEPHKIEAKLNLAGNIKWQTDWFKHLKFPRVKIDSLILAFNEEEMKHVHMLYDRGLVNKLDPKDLKVLTREEVLKKEPNVNPEVLGALLCTSSVAIHPVEATKALLGASKQNGTELRVSSEVTDIKYENNEFTITLNGTDKVVAKKVVNAAGHYADILANKFKFDDFKQTTRRGEYRILDNYDKNLIGSVLFKVPTIHGKGVIVAPTLDGHYLVGPTAEEGVPREDTRLVTREKYDYIGEIGKKIVPSLKLERTIMTLSGSRPIDVETNDFVIRKSKNNPHFVLAAGMQSPALSSAPSIAEEIVKLLELKLEKRKNFKPDYEIDVF
ncbi:type 2 glycerol-3-phosphate oxidase [Mycoplasmopsis anatis]|uniref:type 2 glycerol-3-phosphate oxidase n=1 Tax=Mycoplasmopsis anatis TaxID=171279 RepID=UPI001C4E29A4|nr:type 2 glycerol-3-phosphate oxidase [Mycoplasmopsis anatis]MBW0594511.1 type 2 glycerol-3-phosphate oxidase [Mycoplasmopsis anatis]MBW0595248.1 type 2 glycerol-3-phosphate oxidase [Mycoplasmopsis anatis]MBW0598074.1 type 2 glycerol-3-phosphate oxidase [Mycoplasmopsis anatis]MBW0598929.1 type 2 glycerol-3-phosphate oxidase [Mycoplasmopsis anatis]MBW0601106.1 type 2 glycerol-3-phosphate oxidase [Mycoplasmopsis anatis]